MKILLCWLSVLCLTARPQVSAQSIYQDALILSSADYLPYEESVLDDYHGGDTSYLSYLSKYMPDAGDTFVSSDAIKLHFKKNPFIGGFVETGGTSSLLAALPVGSLIAPFEALGTDFSTVGDGLSQFLIQRTRTELAVSLFRSFKKELAAQPELQMLFPQTYQLLDAVDTEIYKLDAYVQAIRSAFRADLSSGLLNVERLMRSDLLENKFKSPAVRAMVTELLPAARNVIEGEHPALAIDQLSSSLSLRDEPVLRGFQQNLNLVNLVSQSLYDAGRQRWLTADELRLLLRGNKGRTFRIYLGLLYERGRALNAIQQAMYILDPETFSAILDGELPAIVRERVASMKVDEPISLYGLNTILDQAATGGAEIDRTEVLGAAQAQVQKSMQSVLEAFEKEGRLDSLRTVLEDFVFNLKGVDRAYSELKSIKDDPDQEAGFDDYFRVVQSTRGVIESGYAFKAALLGTPIEDHEVDRVLGYLDIMSRIGLSIQQKNYSTILIGVTALLTEAVLPQSIEAYRRKILRYGGLVAGLAEAESPEEVNLALEAAVLPPGSTSLKKLNSFTVSLGGYAGGFVGSEYLRDTPGWNPTLTTGLTMPVGLSFSLGLSRKDRGALTLFLPVIDVGAFGALRLDDDVVERLPAVKLKNLFAPGASLVYDIRGAPVSVGFGFQLGPNVREFRREIGNDGVEIVRPAGTGAYRWSGFVAMDIPFFNLYTKYR